MSYDIRTISRSTDNGRRSWDGTVAEADRRKHRPIMWPFQLLYDLVVSYANSYYQHQWTATILHGVNCWSVCGCVCLCLCTPATPRVSEMTYYVELDIQYDTIRYDIVYLTCSKKLTCLSPPHETNRKIKEITN